MKALFRPIYFQAHDLVGIAVVLAYFAVMIWLLCGAPGMMP